MKRDSISNEMARRIALAAQGFADQRPDKPKDRRALKKVLARTALFQIDSVNVLARAHYMPLYSRLGNYPQSLLDDAATGRKSRILFEYWAHEASFLPVELWPLMQWRMRRAEKGQRIYKGLVQFRNDNKAFVDGVLKHIHDNGAVVGGDIEDEHDQRGKGGWWGWSKRKHALEWLFWAGKITTAERRGFARVYDIPERVFHSSLLDRPVPDEADAIRELLRISARSLGVATGLDLKDYFRLPPDDVNKRLPELVEAGELLPIAVRGWKPAAYIHKDAKMPRKIEARALLSPFDPVVWERSRSERLYDFHYRIEIYTPAHKRIFGYYTLPFLLGDNVVGRVDLKADRKASELQVKATHAEAAAPPETAVALYDELTLMAEWLGLEKIVITKKGDLAPALKKVSR
ncbi:MAG TPA: winged helix-turn-helix domain-containing protein [Rhizobiaceae bacterium]|nr:winged helix-turn-helix domain-containing protein [Rhizobiaceae bacterium]